MRRFHLLLTIAALFWVSLPCQAGHPRVLVTSDNLAAIKQKFETADWAKAGYAQLREGIDPIVERTKLDPEYAASRLLMNWDTHYVTPWVADRKSAGGEGHAELPTPRFAGARNWITDYRNPAKFEDWRPYNDQGGKICLRNSKTGAMEWVDPGLTGRTIETGNEQIMNYAADAAFVYWVTGDETYARFAAHILTTYFDGLALTTAPKIIKPDEGLKKIIGLSSFEVIHEGLVRPAAISFDFVQPYLKAKRIDTKNIENGLRRYAQVITDGGMNGGNWNMFQASIITFAALALEDDNTYPDRRGRQYYIDVVLNAELPSQRGLTHVIKEGLDPQSKLWPEAASYGFSAAGQLLELSYLLSADPAGAKVMADPVLLESVLAAQQIIYPNGLSNGVGDAINVRLSARPLELLVAYARGRKDVDLETRATGLLIREIQNGHYDRGRAVDVFALTKYVDQLKPVPPASGGGDRSFWFDGLNILMQRNGDDVTRGLAAAFYGTNGGHVHANGMAIELYGAGYIMGADPGRGSSYWSADHHDYYMQPLAHNTVVVNGTSAYNPGNSDDKKMILEAIEPKPVQAALSPNIGFAQATFQYAKPNARQHRTLAIIRTSATSGFYFDVFRSMTVEPAQSDFNDYVYHNMGQSVSLPDGPSRERSEELQRSGVMKAYSYLKDEKSGKLNGGLHAVWSLKPPESSTASMALWMPAGPRRTVFTTNAPTNNAIRDGIPAPLRGLPMPTLIIRQTGEAWDEPFVAVYEPYFGDGESVRSVTPLPNAAAGMTATAVDTRDGRVVVLTDNGKLEHSVAGMEFSGTFAAVFGDAGQEQELYLGLGRKLSVTNGASLTAVDADIAASARKDGDAWVIGSTGPLTAALPFQGVIGRMLVADGKLVNGVKWQERDGHAFATFNFSGGREVRMTVVPPK